MRKWRIHNEWSAGRIQAYKCWVPYGALRYIGQIARTCDDFALSLVIDFALTNDLPIIITNQTTPGGRFPFEYDDASHFRRDILAHTGTDDLFQQSMIVSGTTPGDCGMLDQAQVGQLIFSVDPEKFNAHHVQVVTATSDGRVTIAQGNKQLGNKDPGSMFYSGVDVASYDYLRDSATGKWQYKGTHSEWYDQIKADNSYLCEWDYLSWNNWFAFKKIQAKTDRTGPMCSVPPTQNMSLSSGLVGYSSCRIPAR